MTLDVVSPEISEKKHFLFEVNDIRYRTDDSIQTGRGILQKAGFTPASEHVLIELTQSGSRSIGLDEDVDLGQPGREGFRAFASDRVYSFTVNERGYEWGVPTISEMELREITSIPENKVFFLERKDGPDELLEDGDSVDLAARGTEHNHEHSSHAQSRSC